MSLLKRVNPESVPLNKLGTSTLKQIHKRSSNNGRREQNRKDDTKYLEAINYKDKIKGEEINYIDLFQ